MSQRAGMPTSFDPTSADVTLFDALLRAGRRHGATKPILEDAERKPINTRQLILASLVLGGKLAEKTRRSETVGVLLPNVNGLVVTLFGLNAYGRVAALLNFTAGSRNLTSAVRTALITRIVTSRRFIEQAHLDDVLAALVAVEVSPGKRMEVIYLEDVRRSIGTLDKVKGALASVAPGWFHSRFARRAEQPAVVLFTSGTEGEPKGVVLSNGNLAANAHQILAHAEGVLGPADTMLNPLPMFHSYGLTAGTLMPLLGGMKVVLYPTPLHYKQIPKLIRDTQATVMVATDTFLQGYARAADPGDLQSVRFVVAGAERVKDATRSMWDKAGTIILEGYGATECSPVVACNLPLDNRSGSVGALLPGIDYRLEPVQGIAEGGRLQIKGANVMLGYMLPGNPGVVVPPPEGWHDTGDIVTVGPDRVVTIKGRAKRFAKIAGEMVSLAAVESMVSTVWPDSNHVVLALPDARKGEQLVLVTDRANADKDTLLKSAHVQGVPELWVPKAVLVVGAIPVLGSGKVDLPGTLDLVRQMRPLL